MDSVASFETDFEMFFETCVGSPLKLQTRSRIMLHRVKVEIRSSGSTHSDGIALSGDNDATGLGQVYDSYVNIYDRGDIGVSWQCNRARYAPSRSARSGPSQGS